MRRLLLLAAALGAAACCGQEVIARPLPLAITHENALVRVPQPSQIVVPSGTIVPVALTRAIWAKTASAGEAVYAETVFPVAIDNRMAIPAGTYAEGQIDSIARQGRITFHAQLQIHFTKLIFANGYTVGFPDLQNSEAAASGAQTATNSANETDVIPAVSNPYVEVSAASDVLLDNGTQIEMVLQRPLALDRSEVMDAVSRSTPALIAMFKSATLCRPIPATPGTPGTADTVIPGTPGTPGTPPTVIPGGPGLPDIVIPGTPATPGTPDTVIPGTPGTPGTPEISCPGPPVITSSPKEYNGDFQINAPALLSGTLLHPGKYQISWLGLNPEVAFEIKQKSDVIVRDSARLFILEEKSQANTSQMRTNHDGSVSLESLRFAGQNYALYFDVNTK